MALIQAPVANVTYTVNGHSYTSNQAGQFTCNDANDLALLARMGLSPYVAPTIPPSGGSSGGITRVTLDMD